MKLGRNKHNLISIYIIDYNPVVLHGLKSIINSEEDLCVCGEATDNNKAIIKDIKLLKPNVVTVELYPDSGNSMELIEDIVSLFPETSILVLSRFDETVYAEKVIKIGARGYIMKSEPTFKIIDAIRSILSGKIYLSDRIKEIHDRKSVTI